MTTNAFLTILNGSYRLVRGISATTGAADANKLVATDSTTGKLNASLLPADLDVFVLAGQSNMAGNSESTAYNERVDYSDPRILQNSVYGTLTNRIIIARDPVDHPDVAAQSMAGKIGLGMPFAREYIQNNPFSTVLLLPFARGGTGFSDNNWRVGDVRYNAVITHTNSVLAANPRAKLRGILWHQGEKEAAAAISKAQYITWLDAMINGWRAAITGASQVPFIAGELSGSWVGTQANGANIQSAIQELPTRLPFTAVTSSQGFLLHDGVHFTGASYRIFGVRYFQKYLEVVNGIISTPPVILPPEVPTNLLITPASNSFTADWTQVGATTKWILEYKLSTGSTWTAVDVLSKPTTIGGLTPASNYDVRIKAVNFTEESAYSAISTVTTTAVVVTVPTPQFKYTFANNNYTDSSGNGANGTLIISTASGANPRIENDTTRGLIFRVARDGYIDTTVKLNVNYSQSIWVNVTAWERSAVFMGAKGNTTPSHIWWIFETTATNGLNRIMAGNEGNFENSEDLELPPINTWVHLAVTFNNTGRILKFYRNGILTATKEPTTAFAGAVTNARTVKIAMFDPTITNGLYNFGFSGKISNPQVWNVVLTNEQIQALYQSELL